MRLSKAGEKMSNYLYTNDGLINTDDLIHYGVAGMKWGVRRAQRLDRASARAERRGNTKRADKLAEKSRKQKAATNRIRKDAADIYGKAAVDRAAKASGIRNYVKTSLLGNYGSMKYNQYVTKNGGSRGKAFAKAYGSVLLNDLSFGRKAFKEEMRL